MQDEVSFPLAAFPASEADQRRAEKVQVFWDQVLLACTKAQAI